MPPDVAVSGGLNINHAAQKKGKKEEDQGQAVSFFPFLLFSFLSVYPPSFLSSFFLLFLSFPSFFLF
jgi:hypothetical protein